MTEDARLEARRAWLRSLSEEDRNFIARYGEDQWRKWKARQQAMNDQPIQQQTEPIEESEPQETEESKFQAERYEIARGIESQQLENQEELITTQLANESELQKQRLQILETKRQLLAKIAESAQKEEDDQKANSERMNKALTDLVESCGQVGKTFQKAFHEALELLFNGRATNVTFDFFLMEGKESGIKVVSFSVQPRNEHKKVLKIDEQD